MQITLSKSSDVPLRQQLAEQIVFLITTGQLRAGQQLPSVRALARRVNIHRNTVSEAYQDLVRRNWLTRQRGSRLVVGKQAGTVPKSPDNLDELLDEMIERAMRMGFSLQELTERVRARILAQPPDRVLIVEEESGLRKIICREIHDQFNWIVNGCSPGELASDPQLATGAQVLAPSHMIAELKRLIPGQRPALPITYSEADAHLSAIRSLKKPSIVAAVSISESVLKTARSLFAPAIGRKHTFRAVLAQQDRGINLASADIAFCDCFTISLAKCRCKALYRLVASDCLEYLAAAVQVDRRV